MVYRSKNATYRLSQVEAVIAALFDGPYQEAASRTNLELDEKLRYRVRRMLQIDREHGIRMGSRLSEQPMAFFEELPTGKGHPVRFTPQKAFNLILACELLRFGFNQGEVVEAIGIVDADLREAFDRSVDDLEIAGWTKHFPFKNREKAADLRWFLLMTSVVVSPDETELSNSMLKSNWLDYEERPPSLEVVQSESHAMGRLLRVSNDYLQAIGVLELSQLAARVLELLPLQAEKRAGRRVKNFKNSNYSW